ncbi:MAG TPA: hypothetical protein DCL15_21865 [Chloroflexi bacterium]|nr:hypothetical protein [Chloroflexota bacterium]HHW87055.1 DUF3592 domain-containing protein [Chloroflexota bacterium]
MEKLLFWLFLGIALFMLVVATVTGVQAQRTLSREIRVNGFVTELMTRTDATGNTLYYPIVAFTLPDGSRKRLPTTLGDWPAAYTVDEAVTVLFDPAQPAYARIDSPTNIWVDWLWTLVTGVLGVAFLLAALLAYRLGTADRRM